LYNWIEPLFLALREISVPIDKNEKRGPFFNSACRFFGNKDRSEGQINEMLSGFTKESVTV
jgi:hypothetical protein